MQRKKEIHFRHDDGQDYFISLPSPRPTGDNSPFYQLLDLLAAYGIWPVYEVEEDVKGRYLTIYVNKSLRVLEEENIQLPENVLLRYGNEEPYILMEGPSIIAYNPDFMEVVDRVWKAAAL